MGTRRLVALVPVFIALACGGNPFGPSGGRSSGTLVVDGQTFHGTAEGSLVGSRASAGLNWVDFIIGSCAGPPGIAFTLKEVSTPPAPGVYAISPTADVITANSNLGDGQMWNASSTHMGTYCANGGPLAGVLPACTATTPGSGSVTIASSSSSRVSGSYRFVLVVLPTFSGPISQRPAPQTKAVEGTFDLAFDDRVLCG